MIFSGIHNQQFSTGRELGRGGEGTVYELKNDSSRVLKLYNEPLASTQTEKLKQMIAMRNPAIEAYAAWPTDLVTDDKGAVCGFVMKKLAGYVPLHMIFSPMDRKKTFPDKGYNFLVHVARNLATAFHKLHEAGLVVGDVNEGNILINASGLISFIDCDSFQVKKDNSYFFCEVGVPRYTPPELLSSASFSNVIRTENTDSFSLAVLIFQLLFLGRHPFAGINRSAKDMDEETAIKQHEFAYSLTNKKKKLHPPKGSFNIESLSARLIAFFHRSFEQDGGRPLPADWVVALDAFLLEMVTCSAFKLHSYPGSLTECPWCKFRKTQGIMYFLDDSYLQASTILNDIDTFVNGFKAEKLELKKWVGNQLNATVAPMPIAGKWHRYRFIHWGVLIAGILAMISVLFSGILRSLYQGQAIQAFLFIGTLCLVVWHQRNPARAKIKDEKERLQSMVRQLKDHLNKQIHEYNNPADQKPYTAGLQKLDQLVKEVKNLPEEYAMRQKLMEERLYNEQLHDYLRLFDILQHAIPTFGAGKKELLLNAGIRNAADISRLRTTKVSGIGPKSEQILMGWQRQMESGFVYIPDSHKLTIGREQVDHDITGLKLLLESQIRKEYQSLNYMKLNISNRAMVLENQINSLELKVNQAETDMKRFYRFSILL